MGLEPHTSMVSEYSGHMSKMVFSALGILGRHRRRAIVAANGVFSYFLVLEADAFHLAVDKSRLVTPEGGPVIAEMERQFRLTYAELSLERVAETLEASGTAWRIERSVRCRAAARIRTQHPDRAPDGARL
jgi:hypothetical protein